MGARIWPATLSSSSEASSSTGIRAAAGWATARGLTTTTHKRWHVEISLTTTDAPTPLNYDDRVDTRFHVDIYSEEWGFFFCHGGKASWIRVTDIPFVHGRDDFQMLSTAPLLEDVGTLLRGIETKHQLQFRRRHALIRTNLAGAEPGIRAWIASL